MNLGSQVTFNFRSVVFRSKLILGPFLTILLLFPTASAQTFTLLHQFKSGGGGLNPEAGLVLDGKGNLYGTTTNDGAFASGLFS